MSIFRKRNKPRIIPPWESARKDHRMSVWADLWESVFDGFAFVFWILVYAIGGAFCLLLCTVFGIILAAAIPPFGFSIDMLHQMTYGWLR